MPASEVFAGELLAHILNNVDIANVGDAAGLQNSAAAGSLWLQLHESGGETTYTGYSRVAIARNGTAWTVTGRRAYLTSAIEFGENTGGNVTITSVAIGKAASGGDILYTGTLGSPLLVETGRIPRLNTDSFVEA